MEVICLSESYRSGLKIEQILFISTNVAQSNYEDDKWMFLRKIVQQYPWRVTTSVSNADYRLPGYPDI